MPQNVEVLRRLELRKEGDGKYARITAIMKNGTAGSLAKGDIVTLDHADATGNAVDTTTSAADADVFGMADEAIASGAYGRILLFGHTDSLKVDGTTDIAVADEIATFTTAGIGAKAANDEVSIAKALEAYTTDDSAGVIDAIVHFPAVMATSGAGGTLDAAYDSGGAGVGRSVTVNDGAVALTKNDAGTENVLEVDSSPSAGAAGAGVKVTMGANATGAGVDFANSGSGNDVEGTDDLWTVSKAGAALFATVDVNGTADAVILDADGDTTISAPTEDQIDFETNGTDVFRLTATQVQVLAGATAGLSVNTGGVTVSAGGATVTGNSTVTGDLSVTGSLTFGGNWTVGNVLTVDELVLDTDGDAANVAATAVGLFRDNAGDGTLNIVAGKTFNVSHANTDEYTFSSTIADFLNNALDNVGYVIMNAATAPAGTEVYAVNDNTGDLTVNALDTKAVHVAVNGTDEYNFHGTEFELASGNNIQFLGDNAIVDSNANELVEFSATASATNGLLIKNAATGNPVIVSAQGTGATANRGIQFNDSNGNEALILASVASAVNELTVVNAATTASPIVRVTGEADMGVIVQNAASEPIFQVAVGGTAPLNWLTAKAGDTAVQVILANDGEDDVGFLFNAKNAEEMLSLKATAAATTYVELLSMSTGTTGPAIKALGETNVNLRLVPNGTGQVNVAPGTAGTAAAPDLVIGGDVDSGLFGGTNVLGLATAGAQALYVTAAQAVIVGTTTSSSFTGIGKTMVFDEITAPGGTATNQAAIYAYDSGGTTKMATRNSAGTASDI